MRLGTGTPGACEFAPLARGPRERLPRNLPAYHPARPMTPVPKPATTNQKTALPPLPFLPASPSDPGTWVGTWTGWPAGVLTLGGGRYTPACAQTEGGFARRIDDISRHEMMARTGKPSHQWVECGLV